MKFHTLMLFNPHLFPLLQRCVVWCVTKVTVRTSAASAMTVGRGHCATRWPVTIGVITTASVTTARVSVRRAGMENIARSVSPVFLRIVKFKWSAEDAFIRCSPISSRFVHLLRLCASRIEECMVRVCGWILGTSGNLSRSRGQYSPFFSFDPFLQQIHLS